MLYPISDSEQLSHSTEGGVVVVMVLTLKYISVVLVKRVVTIDVKIINQLKIK